MVSLLALGGRPFQKLMLQLDLLSAELKCATARLMGITIEQTTQILAHQRQSAAVAVGATRVVLVQQRIDDFFGRKSAQPFGDLCDQKRYAAEMTVEVSHTRARRPLCTVSACPGLARHRPPVMHLELGALSVWERRSRAAKGSNVIPFS